jgi:hypothetical protein
VLLCSVDPGGHGLEEGELQRGVAGEGKSSCSCGKAHREEKGRRRAPRWFAASRGGGEWREALGEKTAGWGARLWDFLDAMVGSLTARASPAPWIQGAAARWRGRAGRCSVREEEGAGAGATAPWLAERSRPGRHGRKWALALVLPAGHHEEEDRERVHVG